MLSVNNISRVQFGKNTTTITPQKVIDWILTNKYAQIEHQGGVGTNHPDKLVFRNQPTPVHIPGQHDRNTTHNPFAREVAHRLGRTLGELKQAITARRPLTRKEKKRPAFA